MIQLAEDEMMARIVDNPDLRNREGVFRDRLDAGKELSNHILEHRKIEDTVVCAIPAGGVPVGLEIALALKAPLMVGVVRKVQIPWNPEAGFGAVTWDGRVFLNEELLSHLNLSQYEIDAAIERTRENVQERLSIFLGEGILPSIEGKSVIITDDGLASGYTMLAAVDSIKSLAPREIIVAVPTGSKSAVSLVSEVVDELICLNVRGEYYYAVASAYEHWYDLSNEEVEGYLKRARDAGLL